MVFAMKFESLVHKLFRGYPMTYSEEFFFDCWFWDPVDLYVDKLGRKWIARGPWDLSRRALRERS